MAEAIQTKSAAPARSAGTPAPVGKPLEPVPPHVAAAQAEMDQLRAERDQYKAEFDRLRAQAEAAPLAEQANRTSPSYGVPAQPQWDRPEAPRPAHDRRTALVFVPAGTIAGLPGEHREMDSVRQVNRLRLTTEKVLEEVRDVETGKLLQRDTGKRLMSWHPDADLERRLTSGKQLFLVSLPGLKTLVRDPDKDVNLRLDKVPVWATNQGEALMLFYRFNGVCSTNQTPKFEHFPEG